MPYDRFEYERSMAAGMTAAFDVLRHQAALGAAIDWDAFERRIATVMSDELIAAYVVVLLLLMPDELWARRMAQQYVAQVAPALAANLAASASAAYRSGQRLDFVLTPGRAEVIAATEVTRAQTAAETAGRRRAGAEETARGREAGQPSRPHAPIGPLDVSPLVGVVWNTERDQRVCPICSPLDGLEYAGWADKFPFGPPAHPNCRCTLSYPALLQNNTPPA